VGAQLLEHAIYANVAAGLVVSGCRFERIGAQAVQTVWRAKETTHPELVDDDSLIIVEDSIAIGCGRIEGIGRAAFAFSFFDGPGEVIVRRCALRSHQPPFGHKAGNVGPQWFESFGAIMAQGHRRVELRELSIAYVNPDRPIIQLQNCPQVVLESIHVEYPALVRIKGCPSIVVAGCSGPVTLEVDSVKLPAGTWSGGFSR
jgi:hypothetical protein